MGVENIPGISKLWGIKEGVNRRERRRTRRSRTFSKPNCFSSAMASVGSRVVWVEVGDVVVDCGVANDIHFAAFPIAILGGDGEMEGMWMTTRTRRTRESGTRLEGRVAVSRRGS